MQLTLEESLKGTSAWKRWPWLLEDWGGFCATGFGKKMEFRCEEEPIRGEVK